MVQRCSSLSALVRKYCRNILGEELGPLSMKELDQIENQIDVSLKNIRSRKVEKLNVSYLLHKAKVHQLEIYFCYTDTASV
jgi:hypothetical protein